MPSIPSLPKRPSSAADGTVGLPDSVEAYERATHSCLRSAAADHERRAAATATLRRARACSLLKVLRPFERHIVEMHQQMAWCEHHLNELENVLGKPEPSPDATPTGLHAGEYVSALYGKMEDDDLR